MSHAMRRRSFLALTASLPVVLASGAASADVASPPPPRISVRVTTRTYTTPPTQLDLLVENLETEPLTLQGVRLVVLTGRVRVPVQIRAVERDGVRGGVWDVTNVAARGSVRLRLELGALPESALRERRLELALRLGHAAEQTITLTRR
jgi:hypothetical protein